MASVSNTHTTSTHINNENARLAGRIGFFIVFVLCVVSVIIHAFVLYEDIVSNPNVPRVDAFGSIGVSLSTLGWYRIALRLIYALGWLGIGLLIFLRRSDDYVGLMMATILVLIGSSVSGILGDLILYWTLDGVIGIFLRLIDVVAKVAMVSFWALFPDGKFQPRWMYIFLAVWIITCVFLLLPIDSPFFLFNLPIWFLVIPISVVMIGLLSGQYLSYKNIYTSVQRAQVRWVLLGGGIISAINILAYTAIGTLTTQSSPQTVFIMELLAPIAEMSWILIPLAVAISMLRYRLWDVDIVINRSLVYGIVASILIGLIFLTVTVAQFIFAGTNFIFALLVSGILSAALWRPLQQRVQRFVDVHIYRLRFDQNELHAAHQPIKITNPGALSGRTLGRYQVGNLIGQGGMGEVYQAIGDAGVVAIKTIAQVKENMQELHKRFEREAQIGMTLNHPNIAKVYDFGRADNLLYMVQEYLDGEDLKVWMQHENPVELTTATEILHQLALALDAAHEQGFIHRDIKPSNIMLCYNATKESYRVVVMDFGITKIKDASTELTGTGIIGTIDYMAPEQIQARKTIDGRADIYALAIVAYEMLTGQRPFTGNLAQVLFAHMSQPVPDPREYSPDLPSHIAHALMQALEKEPEARFATVSEFVAAFNAA